MSTDDAWGRGGVSLLKSVRRWTLWSQRPWLIAYCVLIVLISVVATFFAAVAVPVKPGDWAVLAALVIMGVVQEELGRQVERVRRRTIGTIHINLTSVWFLPAVLLLPPVLVAGLVATLSWHLYFRSWYRLKQVPAFRTTSSMAVAILTCYGTGAILAALGIGDIRSDIHAGWAAGTATVATGIVAYFVVNAALVTPPTFLVHRAVLIDQLESAARQDGKTGMWNVAGWHRIARRELARAERQAGNAFGVLMVDLDHFKKVNDTYGHLAGDAVLKAVAETIAAVVRPYDEVGRFGGEEFVVLLPDVDQADTRVLAERIRMAIARLEVTVQLEDQERKITGLSASIGIATYPAAGTAIERILQAADTAMYRAKSGGRNRVVHIADPVESSIG